MVIHTVTSQSYHSRDRVNDRHVAVIQSRTLQKLEKNKREGGIFCSRLQAWPNSLECVMNRICRPSADITLIRQKNSEILFFSRWHEHVDNAIHVVFGLEHDFDAAMFLGSLDGHLRAEPLFETDLHRRSRPRIQFAGLRLLR